MLCDVSAAVSEAVADRGGFKEKRGKKAQKVCLDIFQPSHGWRRFERIEETRQYASPL
jgi:hypothetical protein